MVSCALLGKGVTLATKLGQMGELRDKEMSSDADCGAGCVDRMPNLRPLNPKMDRHVSTENVRK